MVARLASVDPLSVLLPLSHGVQELIFQWKIFSLKLEFSWVSNERSALTKNKVRQYTEFIKINNQKPFEFIKIFQLKYLETFLY